MPLELTSLTTDQISLLNPEKTAFFISVGPIEDHGSHLSVGTDLDEAEGLARLTAHQLEEKYPEWKIVFLPKAPIGIETNTSFFSIKVRAHVLRDYLVDTCESLYQSGFKNFVCFTGHSGPKQITAIEEAGKLLRKKHKRLWRNNNLPSLVCAQSVFLDPLETSSVPVWMDPVEHAGKRDTSIALLLNPEKTLPQWQTLPEIKKEGSVLDRFFSYRKKHIRGYWGQPSLASKENGAKFVQEKIDVLIPKLLAVWGGARPDHMFKSWYSIYPTNWSLFKVWVLIALLFVVLGAWISMAFQAMITSTV